MTFNDDLQAMMAARFDQADRHAQGLAGDEQEDQPAAGDDLLTEDDRLALLADFGRSGDITAEELAVADDLDIGQVDQHAINGKALAFLSRGGESMAQIRLLGEQAARDELVNSDVMAAFRASK